MSNMNDEYIRRITVRGVIYKDGKLFCQELKNADGTGRGFWCVPGGGLENGESLVEGLHREMIEETGVKPVIGKLLFVQQYSEGKPSGDYEAHEFLEFFFHIENADDYETIDEHASHFEAEILSYGFIDPTTANVLPKFLRTQSVPDVIAGNAPVLVYAEFDQV